MSPAIPAKQWNQATDVPRAGRRRRWFARRPEHPHGSIRATAQAAPKPLSMPTTVMPAAHDACMASSAVTPSRAAPYPVLVGHGHHRRRRDPADQAGQGALHPGHHDDGVGVGQLVGRGQQPVDPGHAAVGQQRRAEPEGGQGGLALAGHGQVGRARRDHQRPGRARRGRAPDHGGQLAPDLIGPGGSAGDRPDTTGVVGHGASRPGRRRPGSG